MSEGIEKIQSGREILMGLESEGLYVFHGSTNGDIEMLVPRQSKQVIDINSPTEMVDDGNPAVSSTPYSEIAIFRSIMRGQNLGMSDLTTSFGTKNGQLEFYVSSNEALEKAKDKKGYVYVFNKSDFEPYDRNGNASDKNMEWRSYKPVKPIRVVEVNSEDLPEIDKIIVGDK